MTAIIYASNEKTHGVGYGGFRIIRVKEWARGFRGIPIGFSIGVGWAYGD